MEIDREYLRDLYMLLRRRYKRPPRVVDLNAEFGCDKKVIGKVYGENGFSKLKYECGDLNGTVKTRLKLNKNNSEAS